MRGCAGGYTQRVAGGSVALAGMVLVGVGLWARNDVRRGLARERIVMSLEAGAPETPVRSASQVRALAEMIRTITLSAADGRTYAETDEFLAPDGSTTSDRGEALVDERTGQPVRNPSYELWISSTALQSALLQAYMGYRIADLTLGLGATFVAAGIGIAASR